MKRDYLKHLGFTTPVALLTANKSTMSNEIWIVATAIWSSYPNGTKAKATTGGYWIKTERGWHWPGGGTFPTPGGDATGEVCLPDPKEKQIGEDIRTIHTNLRQLCYAKRRANEQEDNHMPLFTCMDEAIISVLADMELRLRKLESKLNEQ